MFDFIFLHSDRSSSNLYIEFPEVICPAELALVSETRLLVLPEAFLLTKWQGIMCEGSMQGCVIES